MRRKREPRKHDIFRAPSNLNNSVVTLTSTLPALRENESTAARNFYFTLNGYGPYGQAAPDTPQVGLWNQYAAMYSLYTIKSVKIRWIPYQP